MIFVLYNTILQYYNLPGVMNLGCSGRENSTACPSGEDRGSKKVQWVGNRPFCTSEARKNGETHCAARGRSP